MSESALLYLDFDGVLHPDDVWVTRLGVELRTPGHKLFEHAELLSEEMTPYPHVRIVLSTSWVLRYGFSKCARRLPPELCGRVIGATSPLYTHRNHFIDQPRGAQVLADVERRRPAAWLAIDDTDEGWTPECRENLVLSDSVKGLGDSSTLNELRLKLQRFTT